MRRGMRKILFICTAGRNRSPTAARVFAQMLESAGQARGFEIRYAGVDSLADVLLTREVADWATEIYVMEEEHKIILRRMFGQPADKIKVLDIEDVYFRDDPVLVEILKSKLKEYV